MNHVSTRRRIISWILLIISLLAIGSVLVPLFTVGKTPYRLDHMKRAVGAYIRQTGSFPATPADLVKLGFVEPSHLDESGAVMQFHIRFGAQAQDLLAREGVLWDKNKDAPVLLISGPYNKRLKNKYQAISMYWYALLLQEKFQRQAAPERVDLNGK